MSSDGVLTFADGVVTLGGKTLPGILVSQTVQAAVRYDESQHDNQSGRKKAILGWDDATITLTLDLLCDAEGDCYAKLQTLNRLFKGAEKGKSAPRIYDVSGSHARARGISRVVFDALDSYESDQEDTIQATLTFVEHLPPVIRREKQASKKNVAQAGTATKAPATKATPAKSPTIVKDDESAIVAGFRAGGGS